MNPNHLRDGASRLRAALPPVAPRRAPPEQSGERIATFARPERGERGEEIRFTFDVYQGKPLVHVQVWSRNSAGDFWPDRDRHFTIRAHELPVLADGIALALERATVLLAGGAK